MTKNVFVLCMALSSILFGCEKNSDNSDEISELQEKDVVNIADGRKLGQIYDLEIDLHKREIKSLIVPAETRLFGWISGGQEWIIPWRQIVKIGSDVILVRLSSAHMDQREHENKYLPAGYGKM